MVVNIHITVVVAKAVRHASSIWVYPHRHDEPAVVLPVIEYDVQPGDVVEWKGERGVGWFRINGRQWTADAVEG